jgi:hypothetical protein
MEEARRTLVSKLPQSAVWGQALTVTMLYLPTMFDQMMKPFKGKQRLSGGWRTFAFDGNDGVKPLCALLGLKSLPVKRCKASRVTVNVVNKIAIGKERAQLRVWLTLKCA